MACDIVSVAIQKGGTGKSTTVFTTAHALAELGKRILVVDLDPQHNTSLVLGKVTPYEQPRTVIDLFTEDDVLFSGCVVPSKYKGVDLISSHIDLFGIGDRLAGSPKSLVGLKNKLDAGITETYDIVLLDCPPHLSGPFVNNALTMSNHFMMPVEAESFFALKGVQQFMQAVKTIQATINPDLKFLGVLITMVDLRTNVTKAMIQAIEQFFTKEKVFKTHITRNTSINKAAMARKTVIDLDGRMSGAHDYRAFAKELVEWLDKGRNE